MQKSGRRPLLCFEREEMAKIKVKDLAERALEPFLAENGYELYNIEFLKEGKDWFLRVYIDKLPDKSSGEQAYIGTEDCEKVSRFLSEQLDILDPVEQNYYLEVSSPGMDRTLFKPADYARFAGHQVEVSLYKPYGEIKNKKAEGELVALLGDSLVIKYGNKGEELQIPLEYVAATKLKVIF